MACSYSLAILYDMDSFLALDAANGIESAVVMWGGAHFCSLPQPDYAKIRPS